MFRCCNRIKPFISQSLNETEKKKHITVPQSTERKNDDDDGRFWTPVDDFFPSSSSYSSPSLHFSCCCWCLLFIRLVFLLLPRSLLAVVLNIARSLNATCPFLWCEAFICIYCLLLIWCWWFQYTFLKHTFSYWRRKKTRSLCACALCLNWVQNCLNSISINYIFLLWFEAFSDFKITESNIESNRFNIITVFDQLSPKISLDDSKSSAICLCTAIDVHQYINSNHSRCTDDAQQNTHVCKKCWRRRCIEIFSNMEIQNWGIDSDLFFEYFILFSSIVWISFVFVCCLISLPL